MTNKKGPSTFQCAPYLEVLRCFSEVRFCVSQQGFPTVSGLRHLTEGKYSLRHPVANPEQFALRCDDILKIVFLMIYWKRR